MLLWKSSTSVFWENGRINYKRQEVLPNATKKAVLLKNCFVYLHSKNDNSIKLPSGEEKPPKVSFNGLSLLAFQAQRMLGYWQK
ncbi:hypothetical protein B0A70_15275 [Chryseobacterium piscicola]|uniref:Uncharacterized protein n=1 Tax=Chryseobacterium piscicola TaxID=551459 RepID=A0A2S7KBG3_9FLAO|nr:hypothetical protein B0A70_15275 [Chryseobacterium piscicola]